MTDSRRPAGSRLPTLAGAAVALAGGAFVGVGLWGRGEVKRALLLERIALDDATGPVASAAAARSLAETIRRNTLASTGGRTYAETPAYLGPDGVATADADQAVKDPVTGRPVESPEHALWIQSTALQTALMQAYVAFRVSDLTLAVGASLLAAGAGLASVARRDA